MSSFQVLSEPGQGARGQDTRTRAWVVVAHGVSLAMAAALLRVESSLASTSGSMLARTVAVAGVAGAVLVFEATLFLLLGRIAPKRWQGVAATVHAAAFMWLLVDHQYFLATGGRLSAEQAFVALKHFSAATGVAAEGLDRRLPWRMAQAAACLAFGTLVASRRPWMPSVARPMAFRAVAPLAGAALWLGPTAFPAGAADRKAQAERAAAGFGELGAEDYRYEAPRILGVDVARRPNVVLVLLESTRASATGPYQDGKEPSDTPELDAIAAEGIVFDTAYTSVTHTSKALVGVVCGAYPRLEVAVKENEPGGNTLSCLPRLLEELGYRSRFMQSARGDFEDFPSLVANMGFGSAVMREQLGGRGFRRAGYFGMDEFALLDPALDWIRSGEEPFFLTVLTSVAHYPYHTPGVEPLEGRENALANYRRAIRHVDEFLGRFVREVEATAMGETLFVITADHGEAFAEHRVRQHDRVPYEEGTRVPLVLKGPSWLGEPRREGGLRQHFDVLPTVLDALGAEWMGRVPGTSLLDQRGHDVVATSCLETRMCMGIRAGDLKFVYRYGQRPTEVYDLAHDPLEKHDLARSFPKALVRKVEARADALTDAVERYWESAPPPAEPIRAARQAPRSFPGREIVAPVSLQDVDAP